MVVPDILNNLLVFKDAKLNDAETYTPGNEEESVAVCSDVVFLWDKICGGRFERGYCLFGLHQPKV